MCIYIFAGGVLDMFVSDDIGIYTWDHICNLCASWIVEGGLFLCE